MSRRDDRTPAEQGCSEHARPVHAVPTQQGGAELVLLDAMPALGPLYARAARHAAVASGTRLAGQAARRVLGGLPLPAPGRRPATPRTGSRPVLAQDALRDLHLVVPEVEVDAAAHAEFCRVVGAPLRSRPDGAVEAFSGYLHALSFPAAMALLTHRSFPVPVVGLVHLSNAIHHEASVAVGDLLGVTVRAVRLRPHHAGAAFDVIAELRGADGELAWTGTSTYLARGVRVEGAEQLEQQERPEFVPPTPTARWSLGGDAGRRYAEVSGDVNPIHLSAPSARALGMKAAIAHGMYTASRALAALEAPQPLHWEVEFGAPLVLPATPAVAVQRTGRGTSFQEGTVTVWDARRRRPHAVLTAQALPPRPPRRPAY